MTDQPRRSRGDARKASREAPPLPEPLPLPVADNHCHLDIADAGWRPPAQAVEAAAEVNVTRIVQVGCDRAGARWAVELSQQHESIVAAVALHPNEAARLAERGELDDAFAEIEALAADPQVRAIGETGLDYFRTGAEGRPVQQQAFRAHIDLAKRLGKTLVIHDRDAHEDVLRIVAEEGPPESWVMHCFSGDADIARRCLDLGAHLSFAGTMTFNNADDLRDALRLAPRDRLLVETDAPYLTPMPYRGRPNASYLIPITVRAMAETRGEDLAALCEAIDANTSAAFGGPWPGYAGAAT